MIWLTLSWETMPWSSPLEKKRQLKLFFLQFLPVFHPPVDFWFYHLSPAHVLSYVYQVISSRRGRLASSRRMLQPKRRRRAKRPRGLTWDVFHVISRKAFRFISQAERWKSQEDGVTFTRNWFGYLSLTCMASRKWYEAKTVSHGEEVGFRGQSG